MDTLLLAIERLIMGANETESRTPVGWRTSFVEPVRIIR